MSIVLLGTSGQLGRAFHELLGHQGREFRAYDETQVDFLRHESLNFRLEGVDAVINCAAYTAVDRAEDEEETATKINGEAVGRLAQRCKGAGTTFVHFSTDYVFDGHATEPYRVDHAISPVNAYGRSKAVGEMKLVESGVEHLLIRTSWVYAPWGNNFVLTMARLMQERPELKVVDDQRGRPTHVAGLASRTLALLDGDRRGTFHVTDEGECTWYGFAQAIAEVIGVDCRISPCTTDEFPRPAARPPYSVLDTSGADDILGPAVSYVERLESMRDTLSAAR